MKNFSYSFTEADIKAITYALSILPSMNIEQNDAQAEINYQLCISAGTKLIKHKNNFSANEVRIIYCSLQAVQLINSGKLNADADVKKECANYFFTINKLLSDFESLLQSKLQ